MRYRNLVMNIYTTMHTDKISTRVIEAYVQLKIANGVSLSYLRYIERAVNAIFYRDRPYKKFITRAVKQRRQNGLLRNVYQQGTLALPIVNILFDDLIKLYEETKDERFMSCIILLFLIITSGLRSITILKTNGLKIKQLLCGGDIGAQIYIYKSSVIQHVFVIPSLSKLLKTKNLSVQDWLNNNLILDDDGYLCKCDYYKILNRFDYLRKGTISSYGIRNGEVVYGYGFGLHEFRRFGAVQLYEIYKDESIVQTFLVHKSVNITRRYLRRFVPIC